MSYVWGEVMTDQWAAMGQVSRVQNNTFSPVRGLGITVAVLIGSTLLFNVLSTVSDWYSYGVVRDYFNDVPGVGEDELEGADTFSALTALPNLFLYIAAAVAFLTWLWRARVNSELTRGAAEHRRARGWVIGGWICPVVNLWFPFQIVDDVHRTSSPRPMQSNGLVVGWWIAFLAGQIIDRILMGAYLQKDITAENLLMTANFSTASSAVTVISGVLVILVVKRVSEWQSAPAPRSPFVEVPYPPVVDPHV
jgi:hypothetical protein